MPIAEIADWEMRIKRQDAFWHNAIIDRPVVCIACGRPGAPAPLPPNLKKWDDIDYQVARVGQCVAATEYYGDALPIAFPNIGPDFFPAGFGGEIEFETTTSYIVHFLEKWEDAAPLRFDFNRRYVKVMEQLYDAFLEAGKERFYIGWPDLHPGADCLAGWRGPQQLCLDLFDYPREVKAALQTVTAEFFKVYDHYHRKLTAAGQPCTGWPGVVSSRRWHVPSNDFSYMIGPDQFREFFLDGLRRECDSMEASLHHLDGPGCLNHLDALLEIASLNAIQWVIGAGNGRASDWLQVYRKVQARGKGIQVMAEPDEIDTLIENLRPEGVFLSVGGVRNGDEAEAVIRKVSRWK